MTDSDEIPMARGGARSADLSGVLAAGERLGAWLTRYAAPLLDLWVRSTMASIFFRSGLQKIGDWPSTLYLFQEEYRVPVLPPELAAFLAAGAELSMPVLLVLGLATRLAALPLLAMALVIQFVLGAADPAFDNPQHILWMTLLASLILRGGGTLSLDHLIIRQRRSRP